jgi:nicotinate-nucleotide adenylyltransferase
LSPQPVLLFGGTFDPVHLGHVALAEAGIAQLRPTQLIVLPAGNPYQKGRAPLATAANRVAMLRLAFDRTDVVIDERELRRDGPTYTVTTLEEVRRERGTNESFVWLIGADAFAKLDTWHRWRELFLLANFAVISRDGMTHTPPSEALSAALKHRHTTIDQLATNAAGHWAPLITTPPPISSTDIRARCRRGESVRAMVPPRVCDYIEQHHLYRSEEVNFNNG